AQVDDLADLVEVVPGVLGDLLLGQPGPRLVAPGGVADERGVVADDDDGRVPEVLELPQLAQGDGVAEVDADAGRVDAVLDAEGRPGRRRAAELLQELVLGDDLVDPAPEDLELFPDVPHRQPPLAGRAGARDPARWPILGTVAISDKVAEPRRVVLPCRT